jgi:ADP-heptose:LPS heptosyltransferase
LLPHLAAAVGIAGVVLFGPANQKVFGYPENVNLVSKVDCRPCGDTARRPECRDNRCMRQIDPDLVVDMLLARISGAR